MKHTVQSRAYNHDNVLSGAGPVTQHVHFVFFISYTENMLSLVLVLSFRI